MPPMGAMLRVDGPKWCSAGQPGRSSARLRAKSCACAVPKKRRRLRLMLCAAAARSLLLGRGWRRLRTSWRGRRRRATRARVPRCNTLSHAVRHVAHNVRENNLLRPIVTRPRTGIPRGKIFRGTPLLKKTTNEGSPDSGALPSRKGCC